MTTNSYLVKALETYSYDLEQCIESLNYALAYEDNNPIAFCLMARAQMEFFKDYKLADQYFREALAADANYTETYSYFFDCLMVREDFEEYEKLLVFARKRKGLEPGLLDFQEARIYERTGKFKKALKAIKAAMLNAQTSCFMNDLEEMKRRVEKKIALK